MVQLVYTEIEINRAPADVRSIVLDFPKYPEWSTEFKIASPKAEVDNGDKLNMEAVGTKFTGTVLKNTTEEFRLLGVVPLMLHGEHYFRFQPSKKTPGGTTFVQAEEFQGIISFLLGPTWSLGKKTEVQFKSFNERLKTRAEGR